ncbi:hypothetical protein SMC26_23285 [Actinomadura fulvescens]|uniref:Uncharacterized protein n=1 Tax=Actinomadura fulvescens TaxID=46160 RepID=A0ABN3QMN1_9ACTN
MREILLALWRLTPLRIGVRLFNVGLNTVSVQDLLTALVQAELVAGLVALAWLLPWERLAVHTHRHLRARAAVKSVLFASHTEAFAFRGGFDLRRVAVPVAAPAAARRGPDRPNAILAFRSKYHLVANTLAT